MLQTLVTLTHHSRLSLVPVQRVMRRLLATLTWYLVDTHFVASSLISNLPQSIVSARRSEQITKREDMEKSANELKAVEDVKTHIKEKGEALMKDVFPAKVIELNKLAESELFSLERMNVIQKCVDDIPMPQQFIVNNGDNLMSKKRKLDSEIEGSQVLVFPEGLIPCNADIIKITNILKPLICVLIEHCNNLKMWIQLLIPKIEDGNNFGVSIQEDTLAELRQVESDAASYLDQITRYFITRGKLISKVAKYPHVEDYRKGVEEIDQKEFFNLRLTCVELRNTYLSLLDLIEKNKDKIKKPRNSNADTLY